MKKLHKIIAASLLASATTMGSGVVLAESPFTANIAVGSNYIWRGVTQTGDLSAVSGGVDYAHGSGAYAGVWQSNLGTGQYEQDIYAGYSFDAGPVGLDLGYISYMYPLGTAANFNEVYVNASYSMFNLGVAVDSDNKNTYISAGAEFEVKKDLTMGVTFGSNDANGSAGDYTHYQLSLSKDDFTIAYDKNDNAGSKARLSVSWSKSFDL